MDPVPATAKTSDAYKVAACYPGELAHMEQVARLAVMLFAECRELHRMGTWELEMLACAALLHDVGISVDYRGHHKKSQKLIMRLDLPSCTTREREIIATVARYHRKAHPSVRHKPFKTLSSADRQTVKRLAALLRPADGLDRAHECAVTDLNATRKLSALWNIAIRGPGDLSYAAWAGERKAGLFEEVFGVRLRFEAAGRAGDDMSGPDGEGF